MLPVTGVTISTAVRGRSKKINTQVLIPFSVLGHDADGIFLVVPHLTTAIILGDDWLTRYKAILNYHTNLIEFVAWNKTCPFGIITHPTDQVNRINVHDSPEDILLTSIEYCLSSLNHYQQHTQGAIQPGTIQMVEDEKLTESLNSFPAVSGVTCNQQEKLY